MKYLDSTPFSIPRPSKVMPGTCERCVWRTGEHVDGCVLQKAREDARSWIRSACDELTAWEWEQERLHGIGTIAVKSWEADQRFRDAYLGHSEGVIYNIKVPE